MRRPAQLEAMPPALVAALVLAAAALAETVARQSALRPADPAQFVLDGLSLSLLAVFTTLPAGLLRAGGAALAVCAAAVVSLTALHTLTVAGALTQVVAFYRFGFEVAGAPRDTFGAGSTRRRTLGSTAARRGALLAAAGRHGRLLLAAALAAPFPLLALTGPRPASTEAAALTMLLAAAAPAALLAGFARRAEARARENGAAHDVIAGTLVEHAARGERARIARELHDVVAHHISMVAVQAETARLTTPGLPEAGAQRLSAIGDTARSALTEMRRLLGVLREDAAADDGAVPGSGTGGDDLRGNQDRLHPQPGLAQLTDLIDEAREAGGTATRLILSGTPVPLDPGVELAAYRIAREALTNARRHAPGAAVDVELRYTDDALHLRVRDNGPGPPDPRDAELPRATGPGTAARTGGLGLTGMRERAAAVGGELRAGRATVGGFLVEARLPAKIEEAA